MMKLKFNPRYKGEAENCIFLLDEPGSYLHSSAQEELLQELKSVSDKNTIIYCTHSQYLLKPDTIRIGAIKICRKKEGVVTMEEYGQSRLDKTTGALAPIYQALDLNVVRDFKDQVLLVEGITDFCAFSLLSEGSISQGGYESAVNVVPAGTASNMGRLVSLALGFATDFLVFVDGDSAGDEAIAEIKRLGGEQLERKAHRYTNPAGDPVKLERLFAKSDQERISSITGVKKFKKALPVFFWDHKTEHEPFLSQLDPSTVENFKPYLELVSTLSKKPA